MSFSAPYFPAFGLNTERYGVFFRIKSECGKIRTRKTPNTEYPSVLGPNARKYGPEKLRILTFFPLVLQRTCGKILVYLEPSQTSRAFFIFLGVFIIWILPLLQKFLRADISQTCNFFEAVVFLRMCLSIKFSEIFQNSSFVDEPLGLAASWFTLSFFKRIHFIRIPRLKKV